MRYAMVLALMILCSSSALAGARAMPTTKADTRVAIIDHAKTNELRPDDPCAAGLVDASLKLLASATEKFKVMVSAQLIDELKEKERGISIVFAAARPVTVTHFKRTVELRELFIPLTGRFAAGKATFFFADPDFAEGNQYVNFSRVPLDQALARCSTLGLEAAD